MRTHGCDPLGYRSGQRVLWLLRSLLLLLLGRGSRRMLLLLLLGVERRGEWLWRRKHLRGTTDAKRSRRPEGRRGRRRGEA